MDNIKKTNEISEAAELFYLTPENTVFCENGDFISATVSGTVCERVVIRKLFPFEENDTYVSVTDVEGNEIGIIENIGVFDDTTVNLLKNELVRRYYVCRLKSVKNIKDRFGFTHWDCIDEDGHDVGFTVEGASSISVKKSDGHIMLFDVDGNRYELPPLESLDKRSRKKAEIYI